MSIISERTRAESRVLSTLHSHTDFSDGRNTAEEMILSAIDIGCTEIGISDHSYLRGEDWVIPRERYAEYFETISRLKDKYAEKIKVYVGIEQDYLSEPVPFEADYIIGSVHAFDFDGKYRSIDLSPSLTRDIIEKDFGGDPYLYAERYFDSVSDIYNRTHCDIIGHFDLVTKFMEVDPTFDIRHPRYLAARNKALSALLSTPAVFEINTGAMSRGYRTSPYPDIEVIKMISARGGKFILTSDSHSITTVSYALADVAETLDTLGVEYFTTLREVKERRAQFSEL